MTDSLRFASTAIILKEPLLVGLVGAFLVGTLWLSGWMQPGVGVFVLVVLAISAWFLGSSEEIVIDPSTRIVTQRHRLLNYVTAENRFAFADFTGVRVERQVSKHTRPVSSPGSGGYANSSETPYEASYVLGLLRANTQVGEISVPHYPVELPMDKRKNARVVEEAALRVARLGGCPAKGRGYAWDSDDSTVLSADFDSESPIISSALRP